MDEEDKSNKTTGKSSVDPVYWYFQREGRERIGGTTTWTRDFTNEDGSKSFRVVGHQVLHANAVFISVLVPTNINEQDFLDILGFVFGEAETIAKAGPLEGRLPIKYQSFLRFDDPRYTDMTSDQARFTGRVFVYTHRDLSKEFVDNATRSGQEFGLFAVFRDAGWMQFLAKRFGRRKVFLGHDSADKDDIVRELAHLLSGVELDVWYDEISLKPGSRLRKSLDDALEETDVFVPIVTENWIANERYAEYEFEAIMHRIITEKSVTILPVCVGVKAERMKERSRLLADTVAIIHKHSESIAQLARRIGNAIEPQMPNVGEPLPDQELPKKEGLFSIGMTFGPMDDDLDK